MIIHALYVENKINYRVEPSNDPMHQDLMCIVVIICILCDTLWCQKANYLVRSGLSLREVTPGAITSDITHSDQLDEQMLNNTYIIANLWRNWFVTNSQTTCMCIRSHTIVRAKEICNGELTFVCSIIDHLIISFIANGSMLW